MSRSLLSLVFQSLHSHTAPVLWHVDCARHPAELNDLLASRVLVPATDATTLPASRVPAQGLELKVRTVGGKLFGVNHDQDDPVEVDLKPETVKRYKIDIPGVVAQLRKATGVRGGISTRFDDGLLNLGERPDPTDPIRVYLAAPVASGEQLLARCRRLHSLHPSRRIAVLTFCPVALDVTLEEEFERRLGFSLQCLRDASDAPAWSPIWPGQTTPGAPLEAADYVFRPVSKGWEIIFAGRTVSIDPSLIGLRYLHYLIAHPRNPVSVEELIATLNPHPDQVGEKGEILIIPSDAGNFGPDPKTLRALRARQEEIKTAIESTSPAKRRALIRDFEKNDKYLRANKSTLKKSGKDGESKRVSFQRAVQRVLKNCPAAMRAHFAEPRLMLGYQPCYIPDSQIDWLT